MLVQITLARAISESYPLQGCSMVSPIYHHVLIIIDGPYLVRTDDQLSAFWAAPCTFDVGLPSFPMPHWGMQSKAIS